MTLTHMVQLVKVLVQDFGNDISLIYKLNPFFTVS